MWKNWQPMPISPSYTPMQSVCGGFYEEISYYMPAISCIPCVCLCGNAALLRVSAVTFCAKMCACVCACTSSIHTGCVCVCVCANPYRRSPLLFTSCQGPWVCIHSSHWSCVCVHLRARAARGADPGAVRDRHVLKVWAGGFQQAGHGGCEGLGG